MPLKDPNMAMPHLLQQPRSPRVGGYPALVEAYPEEAKLLIQVGLRPTLSHLRVLRVFNSDRKRWLDGEGTYRVLLKEDVSTSLPSVYRSLRKLERHDVLLRKWSNGVTGGKASYILNDIDTGKPRYDVICRYCGMTSPLQDAALVEHIRQFTMSDEHICDQHPATLQVTCTRCDHARHRQRPAIIG